MKSSTLILMLFFFGLNICHAQFSEKVDKPKGKRFFLGGSVNFAHSENRGSQILINSTTIITGNSASETSTYNINPTIGLQVTKNWIFGLDFLINNNKSNFDNSPVRTQESSGNSIGVFIRYIVNPNNKFQIYASPYFRKTSLESSFTFNSQQTDLTTEESNNLGISIGAQYEISSWLRLTTNIGGLYYTTGATIASRTNSIEEEIDFSSFGFNFRGSSIYFGAEFLF